MIKSFWVQNTSWLNLGHQHNSQRRGRFYHMAMTTFRLFYPAVSALSRTKREKNQFSCKLKPKEKRKKKSQPESHEVFIYLICNKCIQTPKATALVIVFKQQLYNSGQTCLANLRAFTVVSFVQHLRDWHFNIYYYFWGLFLCTSCKYPINLLFSIKFKQKCQISSEFSAMSTWNLSPKSSIGWILWGDGEGQYTTGKETNKTKPTKEVRSHPHQNPKGK